MSGKPTNIQISSERFRNALKNRGYSQKKISELVNEQFSVEGQPLRNLRTLQQNIHDGFIDRDYLEKICKIINVDPDYITGEDDYFKDASFKRIMKISKEWLSDQEFEEIKSRTDPDGYVIQPYEHHTAQLEVLNHLNLLDRYVRSTAKSDDAFREFSPSVQDYICDVIKHKIDDLFWSELSTLIDQVRKAEER